tara:strand:- start:203 stop:1330 length:1128 start_codon:yes stop_codon:yes gene_type:complete
MAASQSLKWRPSAQQRTKPHNRGGGCACVHLRHLRKTGGQSLVQFFTNLGFERLLPFSPVKAVPGQPSPSRGIGTMADNYGAALQLLAQDRDFFEQNQAGRLVMVEYHSPWAQHGPNFLQQLEPRLIALRAAYASAKCSFLVLTVVRHPVSHFVSDYFYFEPTTRSTPPRLQAKEKGSKASGMAAVKVTVARLALPPVHLVNTTLLARSRKHMDIQMVHLACRKASTCYRITPGLPDPGPRTAYAERYPYATPSVAAVRTALRAYDVVGVTEYLGAMQAEICRRLGWHGARCPEAVEKNTANPVVLLKNTGIGETDAPLTIEDAKRMAQPSEPLHAVLLALAPLTASVHAAALQSWRVGVAASGESVGNFTVVSL